MAGQFSHNYESKFWCMVGTCLCCSRSWWSYQWLEIMCDKDVVWSHITMDYATDPAFFNLHGGTAALWRLLVQSFIWLPTPSISVLHMLMNLCVLWQWTSTLDQHARFRSIWSTLLLAGPCNPYRVALQATVWQWTSSLIFMLTSQEHCPRLRSCKMKLT